MDFPCFLGLRPSDGDACVYRFVQQVLPTNYRGSRGHACLLPKPTLTTLVATVYPEVYHI